MCEQMMGKIDPQAKAKEYIKNLKDRIHEDFGENAEIKVSIEINGVNETDCLTPKDFLDLEAARLNEHLAKKAREKVCSEQLAERAADMLAESVALFVGRLESEINLFKNTVLKAYGKAG